MVRGRKRVKCRECGRKTQRLSQQGLCYHCSVTKNVEAIKELQQGAGDTFDKWQKGIIEGAQKKRVE